MLQNKKTEVLIVDGLSNKSTSNIDATDLPAADSLNNDLPNVDFDQIQAIDIESLVGKDDPRHAPRILVLYGSLRARSFSRLAV